MIGRFSDQELYNLCGFLHEVYAISFDPQSLARELQSVPLLHVLSLRREYLAWAAKRKGGEG